MTVATCHFDGNPRNFARRTGRPFSRYRQEIPAELQMGSQKNARALGSASYLRRIPLICSAQSGPLCARGAISIAIRSQSGVLLRPARIHSVPTTPGLQIRAWKCIVELPRHL